MATAVRTREELLDRLGAQGERLRRAGVARLGVFGSFARGEPRPDSDVDLLVQFAPGRKSFDAFMEVATLLEEVLRRPVEVVTAESLSPHLGPSILREVRDVPLGT